MAILDNFGVTIFTSRPTNPGSSVELNTGWNNVREYKPPGSENHKESYNTCRRYIGIPPIQPHFDEIGTELAIDYKVKCGFRFADQDHVDAEYIVFRTYLDDEKIGSASVKRQRWERSGTYRIRKCGKRYMLEDQQRWIRQRWTFDEGLHGTIRVEVWRERSEVQTANSWGLIDLTRNDEPVLGLQDLETMAFDVNVKQPRVRRLVKTDLLPIATFEFEYRSEDTLRLLGLNTDMEESNSLQDFHKIFTVDDNNDNYEMWRTMTNTSGPAMTIDTVTDTLPDLDPSLDFDMSQLSDLSGTRSNPLVIHTDAIGRSLLTGLEVHASTTSPIVDGLALVEPHQDSHGCGRHSSTIKTWQTGLSAPVKGEDLDNTEIVDLTMFD